MRSHQFSNIIENNKSNFSEKQDRIFQNMSANDKIKFGSQLWKLAKNLIGKKIIKNYKLYYERDRS